MRKISVFLALSIIVCGTCLSLLYGQEEMTVKGLITRRTAETLMVRTADTTQIVTLTDSTKVQSPKGLGLRKQQMSWTSLIPGLKVTVKGISTAEGKFEAKTITFSKADLQTASMIQAGSTPTEERVAANEVETASGVPPFTVPISM